MPDACIEYHSPSFQSEVNRQPLTTPLWLTESQMSPLHDPLILWLGGGSGCSSLDGLFRELGPFHNKVGNLLFLEASRDIGFSYRSSDVKPDFRYDDHYTADDNVLALTSFFEKFPDYKNRSFYIFGGSYGGVYVPMLTNALIKKIQSYDRNSMSYVNLQGVAIGNGEMSQIQQINSAVSLLYFRGVHGKSDYDALSQYCNASKPQTYRDFVSYITIDSSGNVWPKVNDNSIASQANKINYQSTDANGGFACFSRDSTEAYLNLKKSLSTFQLTFHTGPIATSVIYEHYIQQHNNTSAVFDEILNSGYPFRFLIYNGDADMAYPSVSNDIVWNDDKAASDIYLALKNFLTVYPYFSSSEFYVTGESYAGVYVPTLTRHLIEKIQAGDIVLNLVGMSIGNGALSTIQDIRSLTDFMYFHGRYGKSDWDKLHNCCPASTGNTSLMYCNYDYFVTADQSVLEGDIYPKHFSDSSDQNCANIMADLAQDRVWNIYTQNDVYNLYQDCYTKATSMFGSAVNLKPLVHYSGPARFSHSLLDKWQTLCPHLRCLTRYPQTILVAFNAMWMMPLPNIFPKHMSDMRFTFPTTFSPGKNAASWFKKSMSSSTMIRQLFLRIF
ncbi:unnamed protein product [Cylicocyclus nassatus]|uniref:Carboxypeptidase n=1 Tax=Cylicocyclus nassatus TaxID=53992 RepID=A0AA36GWB9_CYLNA|nr:unnamed protein product [Cylicocyclus nassatus]